MKNLYISIGAAGSGKTSIIKKVIEYIPNLKVFSFDTLRHEWYDADNYANAWKMSTEDKEFGSKANQRFRELIETNHCVFVDNTNLTPKRRKFYLIEGKKHGYTTIAITFKTVSLETLLERQLTRGDKCVPEGAVRQQYNSLVLPLFDEFDHVIDSAHLDKHTRLMKEETITPDVN